MVIVDIIIVVALAVSIAAMVNIYYDFKENNVEKISFKETLDLTGLPIVTFYQGKNKFNFLLDTGSSISQINKQLIDENLVEHKNIQTLSTVQGMDGIPRVNQCCELKVSLHKATYEMIAQVNDLSVIFNAIKASTGANIHGIIGSDFFNKYKYIIDFHKYIAYSKK